MRPRTAICSALLVSGFVAVSVIGLTANPTPASATDSNASATVEVSITDSGFQPQTVQVAPGTTVLWTNNGTQSHALVSSTGLFESDPLLPGDSFLFSFSSAGTDDYTSGPLAGSVVVGSAVDVEASRVAVPASPASGSPEKAAASPAASPGATPGGLAFTGAAESAGLAILGIVIVLLGWAVLAAFGVPRVVEPWRVLGFADPRRLGFTDELMPRGLWRRRPRSTTQANLLPAAERRRVHR
jgi:plastocyanin